MKPLMQKSISTKVMALVFYDRQGVIHIDYLNPGETVTTAHCDTVTTLHALSNLQQALRHQRHGKLTHGILFHHNNAPTHNAPKRALLQACCQVVWRPRSMCSEHGWLPCQLAKISLSYSLPVHNWMPPENGIVGGPSEATTLWNWCH